MSVKPSSVRVASKPKEYGYKYDPDHTHRPTTGGPWYRTEYGWSENKQDEVPEGKPGDDKSYKDKSDKEKPGQSDSGNRRPVKGNPPGEAPKDKPGADEPQPPKPKSKLPANWESMDSNEKYGFINGTEDPAVLAELANDDYVGIREMVAANASTPQDVLSKLAGDKAWPVRGNVAANASTPQDVLSKLAKYDNDWRVCVQVAANLSTPASALKWIADNWPAPIAAVAKKNPNYPSHGIDPGAGDPQSPKPAPAPSPEPAPAPKSGASPYATPPHVAEIFGKANDSQFLEALKSRSSKEVLKHRYSQMKADFDTCLAASKLFGDKSLSKDDRLRLALIAAKDPTIRAGLDYGKMTDETLLFFEDYSGKKMKALATKERERREAERGAPLRKEVKDFKNSLGPRGQGRSIAQLKADFLKRMDPSKYDSPKAFAKAKERIMRMSLNDFDAMLMAILDDDEQCELNLAVDDSFDLFE